MLQKRNSQEAPPQMTWAKTVPPLAIALVFDALRFMFEQFWFFGPALFALYCNAKVGEVIGGSLFCSATALAGGFAGVGAIEAFGVVMAMAVGLLGWMTLSLVILLSNGRLFKEQAFGSVWLLFALGVAEVPLIGALPVFTGVVLKLYSAQIKRDKKEMEKYNKEQSATQANEQRNYLAQTQQLYLREQEAANDAQYNEIPENEREAA